MRIALFVIGCWLWLCSGRVWADVFYWTDPDGAAHFSDTAPAGQKAKQLKGWGDCPLRADIVQLDLGDRANLGLWLYLGAPRIIEESPSRRARRYDQWPKSEWEHERDVRSSRLMRLKNEIVREARQCGVGNERACTCSRSLFHDPPRGFAPEGYLRPSGDQVRMLSGHLAQRDLTEP